jgi:hypothetical protein
VFLDDSVKERSRRIGTMSLEQLSVEKEFCVEIYCSVQSRPLIVGFDSGSVGSDPLRLRRRRVRDAVGQSMNPLKDRLKRATYADQAKYRFCFPERETGSVEADGDAR